MLQNLLIDPEPAFDMHPPRRVVSLVPSVTGSLYDLGLGGALVGVTDFCPAVEGGPWDPPRLGGPKNPDLSAIAALKPDLVFANREENSRPRIEALAKMGLKVWLAFPTTVDASMQDLWKLARLFRSEPAMQAVAGLEKSIELARMTAPAEPLRCFCPIWEDALPGGERWWMTFNNSTYPSDLLALFGLENVFALRDRRYPLAADLGLAPAEDAPGDGERDTRYPRVTLAEIQASQPEIILLPDEPYPFTPQHAAEALEVFAGTPAAASGRIFPLDGSLLMWHGTRLARALEELPRFLTI